MGDMGDMYREWNKLKKANKDHNRRKNMKLLKEHGISYIEHTSYFLTIPNQNRKINFYPSTGLWFYSNEPLKQHRGVNSLLKHLNRIIT